MCLAYISIFNVLGGRDVMSDSISAKEVIHYLQAFLENSCQTRNHQLSKLFAQVAYLSTLKMYLLENKMSYVDSYL